MEFTILISRFFIIILLFLSSSAWGKYCIQVATTTIHNEDSLIQELKKLNKFHLADIRIETRKPYLVLRFGNYQKVKQAVQELTIIKQHYKDAYIRECKIDKNKILYPFILNEKEQEDTKTLNRVTESPMQRQTPIWDACQKCFEPMYKN